MTIELYLPVFIGLCFGCLLAGVAIFCVLPWVFLDHERRVRQLREDHAMAMQRSDARERAVTATIDRFGQEFADLCSVLNIRRARLGEKKRGERHADRSRNS